MILVDKPHELLQSVLSLQSSLLSLTVFLSFVSVHLLLVLVAITKLVEPDLNRNEVSLHAVDHMLVGALHHHLPIVSVLDSIEGLLGVVET